MQRQKNECESCLHVTCPTLLLQALHAAAAVFAQNRGICTRFPPSAPVGEHRQQTGESFLLVAPSQSTAVLSSAATNQRPSGLNAFRRLFRPCGRKYSSVVRISPCPALWKLIRYADLR